MPWVAVSAAVPLACQLTSPAPLSSALAGADLNAREVGGWTPLMLAARRGQHEVAQELLRHKGVLLNARSKEHLTALHLACSIPPPAAAGRAGAVAESERDAQLQLQGRVDAVIHTLVRGGANVNARSKEGWTPLHTCCKLGRAGAAAALLGAAGCDRNALTHQGDTALILAARKGQAHVAMLLLQPPQPDRDGGEDGEAVAAIAIAAAAATATAGRARLSTKARGGGQTALHLACLRGSAQLVEAMLCHAEAADTDRDGGRDIQAGDAASHVAELLASRDKARRRPASSRSVPSAPPSAPCARLRPHVHTA